MSSIWVCDWPDGGKQCGAAASWFLDQGSTHRPVCGRCLNLVPQPCDHRAIIAIDPTKVPGPTFVAPPDPWAGPQTVHTSGAAFISDRPANPPPSPMTPLDQAFARQANWKRVPPEELPGYQPNPMPSAQPSRPPLKDAFADLASALLTLGIQKLDDWRKR
jgi:hypothetical protein